MENSKSLPDFLTDGPVRTNAGGVTPSSTDSAGDILRDPPRCARCVELTFELTEIRQRLSRSEDELERNYVRMFNTCFSDFLQFKIVSFRDEQQLQKML